MKKTIITTAIILSTGILATSGIRLVNNTNKANKAQTILTPNTTHSGKEIASAD